MIARYAIKIYPAVRHTDLVKMRDEMKDFNREEMGEASLPQNEFEVTCEPGDLKRITDLIKELEKEVGRFRAIVNRR